METLENRFPFLFNKQADYNTNSPSYYDGLAKYNKILQILAKMIEEYDEKLDNSLENINTVLTNYTTMLDGKLAGFDDSVMLLLREWIDDGTFEMIINTEIFNHKLDTETFNAYKENADSVALSFSERLAQIGDRGVSVKWFGAVGDGIVDDTTAFQTALNSSKKVFVPEGRYLLQRLTLNPENTLFGLNPSDTVLISKTNVIGGAFIEIQKNAYSTSLKNLSLVGNASTPLDVGLHYSNNGTAGVQDSRHISEHLVIRGFKTNFKADSYTRGGYFNDIKSLGALENGFDIRGTDNMILSCLSAGAGYNGFYIIGPNNRVMNCKSYLAGRSMVKGSGFRFNGSFTIASNLEAQENRMESFYFYNCNDSVFNGLLADGSGVYAEGTFPNLEYTDTEFGNTTVPIAILRMHNCKRNVISGVLINARGFNESLGKAKCGIFALYPGLDRNNNLSLTISDRSGDDSFSVKLPKNIQNDVMNNYLINGQNLLDVPSVKSVNYTDFTYAADAGLSVTDKTLAAFINDTTTTTLILTRVLQADAKLVVFGFERAESSTLAQLQIIADLIIKYYDNSDVLITKVSSYKGFTDNSASFDVDEIMSSVSDFKSMDSIRMRFRVGAKVAGTGTIHTLKIKNPILFQSLKM